MAKQQALNLDLGHAGVLAKTLFGARTLANEMHIFKPICLAPGANSQIRGRDLRVLLVEADCWPLSRVTLEELQPALKRHGADVLVLARHDLRKGVPCV
jgi:hypothetical protein